MPEGETVRSACLWVGCGLGYALGVALPLLQGGVVSLAQVGLAQGSEI